MVPKHLMLTVTSESTCIRTVCETGFIFCRSDGGATSPSFACAVSSASSMDISMVLFRVFMAKRGLWNNLI